MKRVYLDVETTGLYHNVNGVHQIAGLIEIDGKVVDTFNYNVRPREDCIIEDAALRVCGVTKEEVLAYPPMQDVYAEFTTLLSKYINKYDKKDKAFFMAYNSHFDMCFMTDWFRQNGDKYFFSFFFTPHIDVMTLAGVFLQSIRPELTAFNLVYVGKILKALKLKPIVDFEIDENNAHDALWDILLTKMVYDTVTSLDNLKIIQG